MSGKCVDRWFGSKWSAEHTPKIASQIQDEKVEFRKSFWTGSFPSKPVLRICDI